jgi:glyceraldehyde 3-phosphate dehydrogenase
MVLIGLNGFGRIGKCVFLQMINNLENHIYAINAPDYDINNLEFYLKHDSVHRYDLSFTIEIIDNNSFLINGKKTFLLRNRNASELDWTSLNINHVVDATGVYLTTKKVKEHNVDHFFICAPPKDDDIPLYVYGANNEKYNGEKIISNASCTTNCIVPVLRHLNDNYGIKMSNFTTIHATTSSQTVVDTVHSKSRTNRSILNNIIPHTTGASSSICKILPFMSDKIIGTSVRVPVNNVSLVDLNVELIKPTELKQILDKMKTNPYLQVVQGNIVSSDLLSTYCPSIIDSNASIEMGHNQFKIMIWYDNEWSYTSQLIKMMETSINYYKQKANS